MLRKDLWVLLQMLSIRELRENKSIRKYASYPFNTFGFEVRSHTCRVQLMRIKVAVVSDSLRPHGL